MFFKSTRNLVSDSAYTVVTVGSVIFSAYCLTRLGVDWAKEGITAIKNKNNPE